MSIRNDVTGRHEDDLMAAAFQNDGRVTLRELLEHLEQTVVGCGFGENVELPVAALCAVMRQLAEGDDIDPYVPSLSELISVVRD